MSDKKVLEKVLAQLDKDIAEGKIKTGNVELPDEAFDESKAIIEVPLKRFKQIREENQALRARVEELKDEVSAQQKQVLDIDEHNTRLQEALSYAKDYIRQVHEGTDTRYANDELIKIEKLEKGHSATTEGSSLKGEGQE